MAYYIHITYVRRSRSCKDSWLGKTNIRRFEPVWERTGTETIDTEMCGVEMHRHGDNRHGNVRCENVPTWKGMT